MLCALVGEPVASAQNAADSAAAQALYDEARKLMNDGAYGEACPKLEESQRLDPGSGTLINLALCYEELGKLASAWTRYLEAAAAARSAGNRPRELEARRRAAALKPRLPTLGIRVAPEAERIEGIDVRRDGKPVGEAQWGIAIPADPGEHRISASAPGHETWSTTVVVEGKSEAWATVPVLAKARGGDAHPEERIGPSERAVRADSGTASASGLGTRRALALVVGGLGVAGLGVGTYFGIKSMSKHDEAEQYCDGSECTDERGVDAGKDAYRAGNVSTVAVIAGGVGIATGAVLWLTAPSDDTAVAVRVQPSGVDVRGTF